MYASQNGPGIQSGMTMHSGTGTRIPLLTGIAYSSGSGAAVPKRRAGGTARHQRRIRRPDPSWHPAMNCSMARTRCRARPLNWSPVPGGGLRCADAVTGITHRAIYPVWVNEQTPTYLVATPPGTKGEPRFEPTFSIDGSKQLLVTARDVLTGRARSGRTARFSG